MAERFKPTPSTAPPERNEVAPLGDHPDYDELLDVAVEYTFPCSDPISVESCCAQARAKPAPGR